MKLKVPESNNSMKGFVFLLLVSVIVVSDCVQQQEHETVKVGAILPMTGYGSVWGINEERGISLALEELGKNGRENVMVLVEDSKSLDNDAVTAAQKLINFDNVDAVYTSFTGPSVAVAPVANQSGVLHLYKAATLKPVILFRDNSIKTGYYTYERDCRLLGAFAGERDYQKIAYIAAQRDFSTECRNGILYANASFVIDDYMFEPSKEDFSSILAIVKGKDYDVIMATGYNADFSKLYKKYNELKMEIPIFCAGGEDCIDKLDDIIPVGTVYFGSEMTEEFKEALLMKYPNMTLMEISIAATSYDMVMLMSEAYQKCSLKDRDCMMNSILNTNAKMATVNSGFENNSIILKAGLFIMNDSREFVRVD